MDVKKIKAIIELVTESGIAELEISEGEDKLRISTINTKEPSATALTNYQAPILQHIPTIPATPIQTPPATIVATPATVEQADIYDDSNYITSPMVGTFYRSASPTSTAFVEVGQEIKAGQVLCIIEAMKLMNQIESEKTGIIKEILIKDGSPVEYGQRLFRIASI